MAVVAVDHALTPIGGRRSSIGAGLVVGVGVVWQRLGELVELVRASASGRDLGDVAVAIAAVVVLAVSCGCAGSTIATGLGC